MQRGNITDYDVRSQYAEMTIGYLSFGLYYRHGYWQQKITCPLSSDRREV